MSDDKRAQVEKLEADYQALRAPRRDNGTVDLIVCRGDEHRCPTAVEVTVADGLVGDRWSEDDDPEHLCQVTLMMTAVARNVVKDKDLHLPGDNFLVDLELADDVLPIGSQIKLGAVVLEVTPEPHTGCATFSGRLGSASLRWVNHKDYRLRRLRGVNCKVITPGKVAVGDAVTVLRRGA